MGALRLVLLVLRRTAGATFNLRSPHMMQSKCSADCGEVHVPSVKKNGKKRKQSTRVQTWMARRASSSLKKVTKP